MAGHVLVTGASGFVAGHLIQTLLRRGYRVTGTVRNRASADQVHSIHAPWADNRLAVQLVGDATAADAYRDALQDVTAVMHTASPFQLQVRDNLAELLQPAVQCTMAILDAVARLAPRVRHVVITSSFAAVGNPSLGPRPGYTYTEKDWNLTTWEDAIAGPAPIAYAASKAFAERAAVGFVEQRRPRFKTTWICPPMIYGPLHRVTSAESLNTSSADIFRFMNGSQSEPGVTMVPAFVDVRDVAEAHVRAMETGQEGRFLVSGGAFQYVDVCRILRSLEWADELGVPDPAQTDKHDVFEVDASRAKAELGLEFTPLDKCISDTAESLRPLLQRQQQQQK